MVVVGYGLDIVTEPKLDLCWCGKYEKKVSCKSAGSYELAAIEFEACLQKLKGNK